MSDAFRSALAIVWCVTAAATFASGVAAQERGIISPDLAPQLESKLPIGSAPAQVASVCGDPEFVNTVGDVTVWRYVSGDEYVLFAFQNGTLAQIARRPRSVREPTRLTWKTMYSRAGVVLGIPLGTSRSAATDALAAAGFPPDDMTCEVPDAARPSKQICRLNTAGRAWQTIAPAGSGEARFVLLFQDDRLRSAVLLIPAASEIQCLATMTDLRAALTSSFSTRAEAIGWWTRKTASAALPLTTVAEATRWQEGSTVASIVRGTVGPSHSQTPALLVVIADRTVSD